MADEQAKAERQLSLHRIYVKGLTFKAQNTPEIFTSTAPTQNLLNVNTSHREIGGDQFEVTLTINVRSTAEGTAAFELEVAQSGVFTITGYAPEERVYLLGAVCPSALYPFAREAVAKAAHRAGFAQLLLQPLDFDALLADSMREQTEADAASTGPSSELADGQAH